LQTAHATIKTAYQATTALVGNGKVAELAEVGFIQFAAVDREERMKRAVLMILMFGMPGANAETAQCSSYYISEINIVSVADTEAGHVQTFVGFGPSKEEAEKSALGACSHISFDLQTCSDSDRISDRNSVSDSGNNSLHLKYMKAVKRITGCG
jgi:hypothetical protein